MKTSSQFLHSEEFGFAKFLKQKRGEVEREDKRLGLLEVAALL